MLIVAFVGITATVFAADFATGTGTNYTNSQFTLGSNTPLSISLSKDVNMSVQLSAQTGAAPNIFVANWVMATYHKAGSRTFGTSNADQKIFFHETTGVTPPTVVDAAGTPPDWGTGGWAPL